ncbi:aldehyde dehydrogenase family protein [Skermania piniformis]|uniref:Aldehyde dehydrogenase n=1 Tax=Skermania pinensis TaxID=39122 RepID=A0ABX8S6I5_9ACTN|nr:aldehyde dehydrogenase family protein [Skermania piniformis]QXQ13463.1 aldehyde dehydrogenase family protein [Skermania piniformis]
MTDHPTTATATRATEAIPDTVRRLRATYATGRTRSARWRQDQLSALERMLREREADFAAALATDLGRPATDAWLADLAPVAAEARHARKHLDGWMRRKRVRVPLSAMPATAWYQPEPLGVVLIIGPWNYPVFLALAPLVGALAAGNCAVVKPSEQTPTVSAVLADLVPRYLDPDAVAVVEGAAAETQDLLAQGLDHAFFTGGPEIGKAVMIGAAAQLTPVTLELGGKSPVLVTANADVTTAARRVAWTKTLNSGQTCVAPDYVLVDRTVADEFCAELNRALDTFLADRPSLLPLVHSRHARRIAGLIDGSGGRIVRGGAVDIDNRSAELTVVLDPDLDSALMREEIFGPVLPVLVVDSLDDAIDHVGRGPKPLAVYLFSDRRDEQEQVLTRLANGGTVINHLMFQVLVTDLPFGGVGNSGMGTYHGKWGFDTFSHRKSVVRKPSRPDPDILYPPYTTIKKWLLRRVF